MGMKQKKNFYEKKIQNGRLKISNFFPSKQVKVYWLARMGQNFDQAKRDITF